MGVGWVILVFVHPVNLHPYFPRLVDYFFRWDGGYLLENFVLWSLLWIMGIHSVPRLVVLHLVLFLLFLGVAYVVLQRKLGASLAHRAFFLLLVSPFPFLAGVFSLPNNDGLTLLFMLLVWGAVGIVPRFLLGFLLGWIHYPSAIAGWLAWMLVRLKAADRTHWALGLGMVMGTLSLKVFLYHTFGVLPDSRLQFLVIWLDWILWMGVQLFPVSLWSFLGPLWFVVFWMEPRERKGFFRALLFAGGLSFLVLDRTRIPALILFWSVLDHLIGNPDVLRKLDGRRLAFLTIFWMLWPFTYVWESFLVLPWMGLIPAPFLRG